MADARAHGARASIKGLGVVTASRTMLTTDADGAVTVQYPHEKEALAARARGVIALDEENCTVCMLCARSCPDWCIYIEGHKDKAPPRREGGKPRTVQYLDRFDIDYALCMYCGICVEVCPFDALFWSPEFEYSEPASPTCSTTRPGSVSGWRRCPSRRPSRSAPRRRRARRSSHAVGRRRRRAQHIAFGMHRRSPWSSRAIRVVTTKNVVHAAL